MKLKKDQMSKIVILLVIVILFNLIFPIHSYAIVGGILTKPLCYLIVKTIDSVNILLNSTLIDPVTQIGDGWQSIMNSDDPLSALTNSYNSQLMSPDKIFMRKITIIKCKYIYSKNTCRYYKYR